MRHFLRDLPQAITNITELAKFLKQFGIKWMNLNVEILRGGVDTLNKLLQNTLVINSHARGSVSTAITMAKTYGKDLPIDGYVIDGKLLKMRIIKK